MTSSLAFKFVLFSNSPIIIIFMHSGVYAEFPLFALLYASICLYAYSVYYGICSIIFAPPVLTPNQVIFIKFVCYCIGLAL